MMNDTKKKRTEEKKGETNQISQHSYSMTKFFTDIVGLVILL